MLAYSFFTDAIEALGYEPLLTLLSDFGGWPMIDKTWDESNFNLQTLLKNLTLINSHNLFSLFVDIDDKDNTNHILKVSLQYTVESTYIKTPIVRPL